MDDRPTARGVGEEQVEQIVLMLFGVSTEEARGKVVRALNTVPGVKEIQVSTYRAEARILHDGRCTPRVLEEAARGVGFTAQWVGAHRTLVPEPVNTNRSSRGDTR